VEWRTNGHIDEIQIEYSIDNSSNWMLVAPANIGNSDSYDWLVPNLFSDECLVRISDNDHPSISDTSNEVFRINSLDLNAPNGKESILTGSTFAIKWGYSPYITDHMVKIEFSSNHGYIWEEIATTDNDGQYEWQVPTFESNQYLVRITDVEDPNYYNQSQDTFKVYSCRQAIIGDLNGDCIVDLFDFSLMANNWLMQGYIEFYMDSLDTNPQWQTEGEWEYGVPLEQGGDTNGNPDPNSGFTGTNVYGVNLSGDYSIAIGGPYNLTAGPFYCKHYSNIVLRFARWLNTDVSDYADARVEVSNDGITWTTVWNNPNSIITDNSWNQVEYDISDVADGQEEVFIRWSYNIFDRAYPYSGWNIDDIGLWGNPK